MKIKITIWQILLLFGLASHWLVSEVIRPVYGIGDGLLPFLLGLAPNFLAAGFIFPFALLSIRESYTTSSQQSNLSNLNNWFWVGAIGSMIGLIIWEFIQLSGGNLVFDINDIGATIVGTILSAGLYFLGRESYIFRP